jgi:hypothetical protein
MNCTFMDGCLQTEVTKKRRISPKSIADQSPLLSLSPRDRSIPLNAAVRTTTKEERPASPVTHLSHDFQLLATTTEAQVQHGHLPLVLHGDDPSTADQMSMAKRRVSADEQTTQSTAVPPGNT